MIQEAREQLQFVLLSSSDPKRLQEKTFVRDHFADAVHCLASVACEENQASIKFTIL